MPHGPLTPLGRRLRSVLSALRPVKYDLDTNSLATVRIPQCPPRYTTNALKRPDVTLRPHGQPRASTAAVPSRAQHVAAVSPEHPQPAVEENDKCNPHLTRRRLNRRTKIDHLGNELRAQSRDLVAPRVVKKKRSNHFSFRRPDGERLYVRNKKRHAADYNPPLEKEKTPTLVRILASYLRGTEETNAGHLQTEGIPDCEPTLADQEFLRQKGYDLADLKAWAIIITEPDSYQAANALKQQAVAKGYLAVPLPIFSYILRRPYISARALRVLVTHSWHLFQELESGARETISADAVFLVFVRLVRHARKVCPGALTSIADHLLRFLPKVGADRNGDVSKSAQRTSYILNKAMFLISEPTAVAPYKDIPHQEAAVVRILTALDEYDAPLQIDREGYRAVIRLQLASPKTSKEQRWAGLKALSWPPWKEDQTRMDTELGPEDGISRAGETIQRMQEAGYGLEPWEHVAKVYAGWDVDGTPTIQRRTALEPVRAGQDSEAALWVARINTTRTVQEAWACYLAYEDAHEKRDQDVLLAIFEKLLQEKTREYKESLYDQQRLRFQPWKMKRLFPGDAKEVEPLPPSTHLYTYTRVDPPTVRQFFAQLRERDVDLRQTCLAYLISNSHSLRNSAEYLRYARTKYPSIGGMIDLDANLNLGDVPNTLFEAYIKFLARFSDSLLPREIRDRQRHPVMSVPCTSRRLADENFNFNHCLIQAIWLLKERRTLHLPSWNAVLDALGRSDNYTHLYLTQNAHERFIDTAERPDSNLNAILAYQLVKQVLKVLLDLHLDLDSYGFLAICRSVENVGIASWKILRDDASAPYLDTPEGPAKKPIAVSEAKKLLRRDKPEWRIQQYFRLLVGGHSDLDRNRSPGSPLPPRAATAPGLPRLLAAPSPAILHAYIRALGWHGAHDSILETVKWMAEYRKELADSADRDRNGANVNRRIMTALRVFLERSWLVERNDSTQDEVKTNAQDPSEDVPISGSGNQVEAESADSGKSVLLQRLESPAPKDVVDDVRALVESVEEWGGWASDEEVEEYIQGGIERFEKLR
ncbi:hypothetical protein Q7P37_006910 [Cladosporium fusiforme]